jgi:uncharacterized protein (DUF849 family)
MTTPSIITVAITGSLPRKENNPAVPITVSEQIESTQAAFEAGATIAHIHVATTIRRRRRTRSASPRCKKVCANTARASSFNSRPAAAPARVLSAAKC